MGEGRWAATVLDHLTYVGELYPLLCMLCTRCMYRRARDSTSVRVSVCAE